MVRAFRIGFFAIDFLCMALFAIGIFVFFKVGKPFQRGFYCDDESISKPYKDSTIPTAMAIGVGVTINVVCIVIIELLNDHRRKVMKPLTSTEADGYQSQNIFGCNTPPTLNRIAWILFVCTYGALITGFVTDVGKYSVGRLRPHFLDICKPKWNSFNCTNDLGRFVYITADVCQGTEAYKDKDSRLSFPSGHSSFSGKCCRSI